jgi:hypothetical protein
VRGVPDAKVAQAANSKAAIFTAPMMSPNALNYTNRLL